MGDKRQTTSRAVIVVDIHKVGTVSDGLPAVPVIRSGTLDSQHFAEAISFGINNSRAGMRFHSISSCLSATSFTTGVPTKMHRTQRSCATSNLMKNRSTALGISGEARTRRVWTGFPEWRLLHLRGTAYRSQLDSRTRPCRPGGRLGNATRTLPRLPPLETMNHH